MQCSLLRTLTPHFAALFRRAIILRMYPQRDSLQEPADFQLASLELAGRVGDSRGGAVRRHLFEAAARVQRCLRARAALWLRTSSADWPLLPH